MAAPPETVREETGEVLGITPAQLVFTPIRTGKFNRSWFVCRSADEGEAEGGWVVRMAPPDNRDAMCFYEHRMMRQEPALHALLRAKTSVPVPEIQHFHERAEDDPEDCDFLVLARLPGKPLSDQPLDPATLDRVLYQVGVALRDTHALTSDQGYGYLGAHRPMAPAPTWNEAFWTMWHALIDDIVRVGGYSLQEADAMRALLDQHADVFTRDVPASLLHMDVWAENILATADGKLTGLIDWDRALWGDPEIEHAVLTYCGIDAPSFWEGYGQPAPDGDDYAIRHRLYLLYEVQKYIVIETARRHDPARAAAFKERVEALAATLR